MYAWLTHKFRGLVLLEVFLNKWTVQTYAMKSNRNHIESPNFADPPQSCGRGSLLWSCSFVQRKIAQDSGICKLNHIYLESLLPKYEVQSVYSQLYSTKMNSTNVTYSPEMSWVQMEVWSKTVPASQEHLEHGQLEAIAKLHAGLLAQGWNQGKDWPWVHDLVCPYVPTTLWYVVPFVPLEIFHVEFFFIFCSWKNQGDSCLVSLPGFNKRDPLLVPFLPIFLCAQTPVVTRSAWRQCFSFTHQATRWTSRSLEAQWSRMQSTVETSYAMKPWEHMRLETLRTKVPKNDICMKGTKGLDRSLLNDFSSQKKYTL